MREERFIARETTTSGVGASAVITTADIAGPTATATMVNIDVPRSATGASDWCPGIITGMDAD